MEQTFSWQPEQSILEKLTALARQQGQSPEAIITEAVRQYLAAATVERTTDSDPLVGLFASSPDLATQSENILEQEITQESGWTWKEPLW
ncbi:MAG TPA: ribbon-helix-helix domain-containing protein [Leptolyngbyaceae cyanobacterium]